MLEYLHLKIVGPAPVMDVWPEDGLLAGSRPNVIGDLGYGVRDATMVETSVRCLGADK